MKFITYVNLGREQVGVLYDERVIPLDQLLGYPIDNMLDLIVSFQPKWLDQIDDRIQAGDSLTLKAGDIICTGTPGGVGMGFEPPIFLKDADIIECCIEKIGKLTNQIAFTE